MGRRFELARLLGDRIAGSGGGKLLPATRASTYRQKMQRSFAAEFLSPFEAVDEMLKGDYSIESQQDMAEHFSVSPLTIRTLLVNHGRLEREDLDGEAEAMVA
jgi:Zn-dependent peptidase ImmA (M78 family)